MPGPCKEWSSGRIHRRRRCDSRLTNALCHAYACLLHMMANFGSGPSGAVKDGHGAGVCKPCAERKKEGQRGNRQQPLPCFLACVMAPVV